MWIRSQIQNMHIGHPKRHIMWRFPRAGLGWFGVQGPEQVGCVGLCIQGVHSVAFGKNRFLGFLVSGFLFWFRASGFRVLGSGPRSQAFVVLFFFWGVAV